MIDHNSPHPSMRQEIAQLAARFIAEDGADYGSAKKRAVKQLLGNQKIRGEILPDNEEIEDEVRQYQALFFADTQPQRLLQLRKLALKLMQNLASFNPYIVGAVLNGTAGEHSDIYLHLYTDNGKDLAIFLINQNQEFEVSEQVDKRGESIETYSFMFQGEGVHLMIHDENKVRDQIRTSKKLQRANSAALAQLIDESSSTNPTI
jgi:hypothetical protein